MKEQSSNDKIQMSNKIQNPNVKTFSEVFGNLSSFLCPNPQRYRKFELLPKVFFWHLSFDIHLAFGL